MNREQFARIKAFARVPRASGDEPVLGLIRNESE